MCFHRLDRGMNEVAQNYVLSDLLQALLLSNSHIGDNQFMQTFFWHLAMLLCIAERQGIFLSNSCIIFEGSGFDLQLSKWRGWWISLWKHYLQSSHNWPQKEMQAGISYNRAGYYVCESCESVGGWGQRCTPRNKHIVLLSPVTETLSEVSSQLWIVLNSSALESL